MLGSLPTSGTKNSTIFCLYNAIAALGMLGWKGCEPPMYAASQKFLNNCKKSLICFTFGILAASVYFPLTKRNIFQSHFKMHCLVEIVFFLSFYYVCCNSQYIALCHQLKNKKFNRTISILPAPLCRFTRTLFIPSMSDAVTSFVNGFSSSWWINYNEYTNFKNNFFLQT